MGESIAIVSGRGGVGKTAFTACLGTALARRGKSVLLIDADTGMRCLDIALGMENKVVYDAVDVIEGNCRLKQAILRDGQRPGLKLLAAAQTRERAALTSEGMRDITSRLRDKYDYILIDAPSGTEQGFDSACAGADSAILLMTADPLGVRSAQRMAGLLEQRGLPAPMLAIDRVRAELVQTGEVLPLERVMDIMRLKAIAVLPEDIEVARACFTGRPLDADSPSGHAYDEAALRLLGEDIPLSMPKVRPPLGRRLRHSIKVLRGVDEPDMEE